MKAIQIRYLGPTNTKGSRLKIMASGVPHAVYPLSYDMNIDDFALKCAKHFCKQYNWPTKIVGGMLPNNDWVFVFKYQKN